MPPVTADPASATIERDGRAVAAIVYDASLDDDPEGVEAVRAAAAMALENESLLAESEVWLAELQASRRRLVAAGDAERQRLERDLHDGAQQRLVACRCSSGCCARTSAATPRTRSSSRSRRAPSSPIGAELRDLARGIHPAGLNHGLASALESLALAQWCTRRSRATLRSAFRGRSSSPCTS